MSATIRRGFNRIREAISNGGSSGTLLPAHRIAYGEAKTVTFQDILTAYSRDPSCKSFVDFLADQAVGMGFYTTVNEEYAKAEEAKQAVDDFNETVNLDTLLQIGAREIVASGNSFWLKTTPQQLQSLQVLPLTGFDNTKAIERNQYGDVTGYNYKFGDAKKKFKPEQIIHFRWNPLNFSAFGTGVLQVLLAELSFDSETRMSFLEMKARIEKIMPEIFEKYAGPDELWVFAGASDKKLAEYTKMITKKPKAGAKFVYNKKDADIKTVAVDPRARYEAYIDHILNQVYLGGQTPIPKLLTTPGFTEASANAAIEVAERHVMSLQRFTKRIVEREIFTPILKQVKLDPKKADCRLNWGMPEKPDIETLLPVLAQIARDRPDVIPTEQFQKLLITMGLPLETEEKTDENNTA